MYRLILFISIAAAISSCNAVTGSGHIVSEDRNLAGFDEVQTSGSIGIEVSNGNGSSVRVEADDNVIGDIVTEINGDRLNVHYRSNVFLHHVHVKVYVSSPNIRKLSVAGSGDIVSKGTLKNDDQVEFHVTGSGDITANVDAPSVLAEIQGSGDITLSGRTKNLKCHAAGSGDFKCHNLLSENTDVSIAGSGSAHVFASVKITAHIAGSGDVYYSGSPGTTNFTGHGTFQQEK